MTLEARKEKTAQYGRRILRFVTPLAVACLLLITLVASGLAGPARPEADTTLKIAPSTKEVPMGITTTTEIVVEDVANLYTFEFQLSFKEDLVEGVKVEPGGFLTPDWELENRIDNESGVVAYALSHLNPREPVTGTGALATITWRGIATGTSPITFSYAALYARGSVALPAATENGEIVVTDALSEFIFLPLVIKQ